ncbi:hypothetical protein QZH56_12265 [Streptomyces olivoreticuli]|uniref:hypothetical protein n=1 Tax=Streptomyces olivoreticuli TaxID=68246 RepID=UPI0026582E0F|nr:hypothetical protein [Streptomyces olivoreticuli]WKK26294.1 hypothetical protein QZH56_12265 [Streptomyces olivoreticuli]
MRRAGSWAGVLALALGAALAPGASAQAAPGDNPGPLKALDSPADRAKLGLVEHRVSDTTISTLDSLLPHAGVGDVLKSANHPMRNRADCAGTEAAALPRSPLASAAYCWDTGDATTQDWLPQSVTTSGDADDDGSWGTDKVILSGWTHNDVKGPAEDDGLARVAFIDAHDPAAFKYRWVLLTVPTEGGRDFAKLGSHLGGMTWYGDKLIVTASNGDAHNNALFVFSMKHILRATANGHEIGKVSGGGYSAHGYQYLMPAIGSYSLSAKCDAKTDQGTPCFGSISLDRSTSPDSIVANEWFSSGGGQPARLFRYSLSAPGGAMPLAVDGGGHAASTEAYETRAVGLQGALSHNGVWYAADARGGAGQHGIMWRLTADGASSARDCGTDLPQACWAEHSESMSLWWNTGQLWSLTEWAANARAEWEPPAIPERVLFSVPLTDLG